MKFLCTQLVLVTAFLFSASASMAHALWIETAHQAEAGIPHKVEVFYGEFASGEIDSLDNYYSDVAQFELWLHLPDGKKVQLETRPGAISLQSEFLPEQNGTYALTISHPAKDLAGEYRYHFLSVAYINVGEPSTLPELQSPLFLRHTPGQHQVGDEVDVTVIAEGKPLADAPVLLMSESGWSKTFTSDSNGNVTLPLPWKGNYVLEASRTISAAEGQAYNKEWQGATVALTAN
ncbi:MAG TPA: DUF4198 domain-containing protein [Candidatus Sphingobacterium stercorigallinarum]|nr:DUF4198 domain-containing protein [Candidatus Sphingobacterium stercorigallinarum]